MKESVESLLVEALQVGGVAQDLRKYGSPDPDVGGQPCGMAG
jgi:hypothetical protein